jgi:uncharacterized protein YqhQ
VLQKNISDSITASRVKNKGTVINMVEKDSKLYMVPYLAIGTLLVLYGASIYILLPLSLISANFGLLLLVFFGIMVGMIFGLTLFVSNF